MGVSSLPPSSGQPHASERQILECFSISYGFQGQEVLSEVSLELARGEVLSLVGPNGSGKSTLLKIIAGVFPLGHVRGLGGGRGEGEIRVLGRSLRELSARERARRVAYVGADLRAEFPMTAREAVMLGRTSQGGRLLESFSRADLDATDEAMSRTGCAALRDRDLHTLSGGERQRVAIARALAQGAKLLLLDESLSRMDLHHQAQMGSFLRTWAAQEAGGVILVSHDWNVATEWADQCLVLRRGERIAAGPVKSTLSSELLDQLYPGAGLQLRPSPVTGAPKVFFGQK